MHGSDAVSCACSLLIRGPILPAVRQKLHLSPCADYRSPLYISHQRIYKRGLSDSFPGAIISGAPHGCYTKPFNPVMKWASSRAIESDGNVMTCLDRTSRPCEFEQIDCKALAHFRLLKVHCCKYVSLICDVTTNEQRNQDVEMIALETL